MNPAPPRDFNMAGWACIAEIRVRPTFFGLARMEQLWQHKDGRREWRRCDYAVSIKQTVPQTSSTS